MGFVVVNDRADVLRALGVWHFKAHLRVVRMNMQSCLGKLIYST